MSAPGTFARHCSTNGSVGSTRGDVVGADDAGEDGRQCAGAAADVEHALPGCDTGGAGELGREHAGCSGP